MRWPYPRTPALGRNLPSNYAEGEKVFDARVKARFPKGMPEGDLVRDLRSEGFALSAPAHEADCFSGTIARGLIFRRIWSVRWRARADRIEDVWGVYGVIAP